MILVSSKRVKLCLVLSSLFCGTCFAAGVVTKTVQVIGTGPSRVAAIESALSAAVAQVSGISVIAETKSASAAASVATIERKSTESSEQSAASVSDAHVNHTQIKTKGIITSYSVSNVV